MTTSYVIAQYELDLAWEALEDALQTHDFDAMTAAVAVWWLAKQGLRDAQIEAGAL